MGSLADEFAIEAGETRNDIRAWECSVSADSSGNERTTVWRLEGTPIPSAPRGPFFTEVAVQRCTVGICDG